MLGGLPLGVEIHVSRALPNDVWALTKRGSVVWDSVFKSPPELPSDPTRWDGILISPACFDALKAQASGT
jgi:hypothetical protein